MPVLGVRQLQDAIRIYDTDDVVLYARGSTTKQAKSLERHVAAEREALVGMGVNLVGVHAGIELGQLNDRPVLQEAADDAMNKGAILCAAFLSRFVRPDDYHLLKNRYARPKAADIRRLLELADYSRLATRHPPNLSWQDENRLATLRGIANRKPTISYEVGRIILGVYEAVHDDEHHWSKKTDTYDSLAARFQIARRTLALLVHDWKDISPDHPQRAYERFGGNLKAARECRAEKEEQYLAERRTA